MVWPSEKCPGCKVPRASQPYVMRTVPVLFFHSYTSIVFLYPTILEQEVNSGHIYTADFHCLHYYPFLCTQLSCNITVLWCTHKIVGLVMLRWSLSPCFSQVASPSDVFINSRLTTSLHSWHSKTVTPRSAFLCTRFHLLCFSLYITIYVHKSYYIGCFIQSTSE